MRFPDRDELAYMFTWPVRFIESVTILAVELIATWKVVRRGRRRLRERPRTGQRNR